MVDGKRAITPLLLALIVVESSTVLLLGGAMLVLPGPGILVTAGGLSILAGEFVWARRWLTRVKETYERARRDTGL